MKILTYDFEEGKLKSGKCVKLKSEDIKEIRQSDNLPKEFYILVLKGNKEYIIDYITLRNM